MASHRGATEGPGDPTASRAEGLVTVVVPVRDNDDGVHEVLRRLAAQTLAPERFEVVIGDDGSRPGSLATLEASNGRVRKVVGPPRTSYAARNRAAGAARGDVLAFCDSDCLPEPSWLEEGLRALEDADLVAGEVVFVPPARPTVWSLLTMDMFLDQARNVVLSNAVTANLLVRRGLFTALGGFDESLVSGGDYDFTERAVARGARLAYAPHAVVRHPTIDAPRPFLRKVWTTNRWSAYRRARSGSRVTPAALMDFVPIVGVARARRNALRPLWRLHRPRLVASGHAPCWRDDALALPVMYFVVSYVAGLGRIRGWLDGRRVGGGPPMRPRGAVARTP